MRTVTLALAAVMALAAACTGFWVDEVAYIRFEGARYQGGPSAGFTITDADLQPAGTASDVRADVIGDRVWALEGVDPADMVVMRSDDGYWVFFREGVVPADVPFSEGIPGLCRYLQSPPPDGC